MEKWVKIGNFLVRARAWHRGAEEEAEPPRPRHMGNMKDGLRSMASEDGTTDCDRDWEALLFTKYARSSL